MDSLFEILNSLQSLIDNKDKIDFTTKFLPLWEKLKEFDPYIPCDETILDGTRLEKITLAYKYKLIVHKIVSQIKFFMASFNKLLTDEVSSRIRTEYRDILNMYEMKTLELMK